MSEKLLAIIVLNWNRLHYTKQTMECLIKKTTVPHVFVLVDNNSTDASGIRPYLSSITTANTKAKQVIHVFNSKNLGVPGGRNSGIYAVEQAGLKPEYLMTIDDDVIVPDNYDIQLTQACDKIPSLGITGINVEPVKYTARDINGVKVRPKTEGNLGGACLCLPRRVFARVGYYKVYGQYGLEDSDMHVRLKKIGLMGAYIDSRGIHLDEDKDKVYRKVKDRAHKKGSTQLKAFVAARTQYEQTGNVFVPYMPYDPDDPKWANYESFDGTINAKMDLREVLDMFAETKGKPVGNKLVIGTDTIDTGAWVGNVPASVVVKILEKVKEANIVYKLKE